MKRNKLFILLSLVIIMISNSFVFGSENKEVAQSSYVLEIDYKFDLVSEFSQGLAYIELGEQKGYINRKGEFVIDISNYKSGEAFSEGLAKVYSEGKVGYIDMKGTLVIPLAFEKATNFSNGYAVVSNNNLYGYIDKSGNYLTAIQYDFASEFDTEGEALVKEADEYKLINTDAQTVITYPYDVVYSFSEGYAGFLSDTGYGYMNKAGETVIEPVYDAVLLVKDGLAPTFIYPLWDYVNLDGEIIGKNFHSADTFNEGMAKVQSLGKMAYIDLSGEVVFNVNKYRYSKPYSEGLSAIKSNDNLGGFIDKTGEVVIPLDFVEVDDFNEGLAPVYNGDKWGYISSDLSAPYYEEDYYETTILTAETSSDFLVTVVMLVIPLILAFIFALLFTKRDLKRKGKK